MKLLAALLFALTSAILSTYLAVRLSDKGLGLVDAVTIVMTVPTLLIAYAGAFMAISNWKSLSRWWKQVKGGNDLVIDTREAQTHWDCLLCTVGNVEVIERILQSSTVSVGCIGLLMSYESERQYFDRIHDLMQQGQIELLGVRRLEDVYSVGESRRQMAELISTARQREFKAIAVEFTGGTKPMSIGAYLAAAANQVQLLYTRSNYKDVKTRMAGGEVLTSPD